MLTFIATLQKRFAHALADALIPPRPSALAEVLPELLLQLVPLVFARVPAPGRANDVERGSPGHPAVDVERASRQSIEQRLEVAEQAVSAHCTSHVETHVRLAELESQVVRLQQFTGFTQPPSAVRVAR